MRHDRWLLLGAIASLCAAGCSSTAPTQIAAGHTAESGSGSTMPVGNYKRERWEQAIAGLSFDTGRVTIDRTVADSIATPGSPVDARAQYDRGMEQMQSNHRDWAVGSFRTAVLLAPAEPLMYEGLGYGLLSKGRSAESLAAYRTALDLEPGRLGALIGAAKALDSASREQEALQAWRQVLEVEPREGMAHRRLASLYYLAGDYPAALAHYEQAEALGTPVPRLLRGMIEDGIATTKSN